MLLFRTHYIEYLVSVISKNKIDPISILDIADVLQELRRRGREFPPRPERCTEFQYKLLCAKVE